MIRAFGRAAMRSCLGEVAAVESGHFGSLFEGSGKFCVPVCDEKWGRDVGTSLCFQSLKGMIDQRMDGNDAGDCVTSCA